jgi:hypothetical protein
LVALIDAHLEPVLIHISYRTNSSNDGIEARPLVRQAVVRKGGAMVSKNAGKQKQAVVKMEIGAGGGQVVAPGEQMRQVVTDAGGKAVPQGAVDT